MSRVNPNKLHILDRIAVGITVIILVIVGMMRRVKLDVNYDFSFLPPIHAVLNTLAALCLIAALIAIKTNKKIWHERLIYIAIGFSFLFLLSYITYHFTTEETKYCFDGMQRTIYFVLLISHVVLAGGVLPFIMFAFNRALTGNYDRHKKMVKWVFPIWLYVTISGPISYLMLSPCYQL